MLEFCLLLAARTAYLQPYSLTVQKASESVCDRQILAYTADGRPVTPPLYPLSAVLVTHSWAARCEGIRNHMNRREFTVLPHGRHNRSVQGRCEQPGCWSFPRTVVLAMARPHRHGWGPAPGLLKPTVVTDMPSECIRPRLSMRQSVASSLKRNPGAAVRGAVTWVMGLAPHGHGQGVGQGVGPRGSRGSRSLPSQCATKGKPAPVGSLMVTPHCQEVHFETDHFVGMRRPLRCLGLVVRTLCSDTGACKLSRVCILRPLSTNSAAGRKAVPCAT
jgi:hypothetical protein